MKNGIQCCGTILEVGGHDVHHILEHLCKHGEELLEGAVQVGSPNTGEGPF